MGFLVGNDFIPHLPDLHISKGALPILYRAYMDILPKVEGNFCIIKYYFIYVKVNKFIT